MAQDVVQPVELIFIEGSVCTLRSQNIKQAAVSADIAAKNAATICADL